jgi:pimeloyl-ACP methyl ester carboxylesterase
MNVVEVDGVKLHVEEDGTGPTVVLVHGIPTDYRVWRPQVDELSKRYRTISYSRRCAFPNQYDDYVKSTIENNATDLEGLIAKTVGGPVSLCGHSYGGPIVALYALRNPKLVRSLVLIEPYLPGILVDQQSTLGNLSLLIRKPSIALSGAKSLSSIKMTQQEVANRNPEQALDTYYSSTWEGGKPKIQLSSSARAMMLDNMETFRELLTGVPTFNREDAERIMPPTLIVSGEHTTKYMRGVAMELHRTIPNSQLATIQNASHYPHIENPEECSAKILAFFTEHAS